MTKPIIVMASGNKGKLREMENLLKDLGVEIKTQSEFNTPEADETGLSFVENAIIKARNACEHSGHPAIADDSGIEIDALNGQPGIYSARFAGAHCSDDDNNAKLVELLKDTPEEKRTARYRCCMVYMHHANDPSPIIADGSWEGVIRLEPQGDGGFGYDPHFLLPELGLTAAQISAAEKNKTSHRAVAMRKLLCKLQ